MLVGKNNSGKSTMVKALLLIHDFLKSKSIESFTFGNSVIEDANIVTFKRALNNSAKINKEEYIIFTNRIGQFEVDVLITGEDDKTNAEIIKFVIRDLFNGFQFVIEPKKSSVIFINKPIDNSRDEESILTNIESKIAELTEIIEHSELKKSSKEYIELIDTRSMFIKKKDELLKRLDICETSDSEEVEDGDSIIDEDFSNDFILASFFSNVKDLNKILDEAIVEIINNQYKPEFIKSQEKTLVSTIFADLRAFYHAEKKVRDAIKAYNQTIDNLALVYLGANPAKQSALFAIRDKNNALAQAIHEYKQLNIDKDKGKDAYKFIEKWMKLFEVGDSFTAELHAGEAYEVLVSDKNSQIALADKGMGSIQAMLLIVRLGCIIAKAQKFKKDYTVLIEEPELNLHPKLQSLLSELFYEVYDKYNIKLIIETHSEYLTRKSQVIVAENDLEVSPNINPFNLFYFPEEGNPYKIGYNSDGSISPNFGSGFYDEASLRTLELMKIKRQRNN